MRVRVEVLPWLSELLGSSPARRIVLEESLPEGDSVGGLLVRLGDQHESFGRLAFDRKRRALGGQVEILLNGTPLDPSTGLATRLQEGDTVTLVPGVAGGQGPRAHGTVLAGKEMSPSPNSCQGAGNAADRGESRL